MKRFLLTSGMFLGAASIALATEREVASNSVVDIETVMAASSDGDVVKLKPGPVTWTTQLKITKFITIKGTGMHPDGGTLITSTYAGGSGTPTKGAIRFDMDGSPFYGPPPTPTWGLADLSFSYEGSGSLAQAALRVDGASSVANPVLGQSANFRVTGVRINSSVVKKIEIDNIIGIFDHCVFGGTASLSQPSHSGWAGYYHAHGSFSEPIEWGSDKALYFEDCLMEDGALDAYHGARIVSRHNTLLGGTTFLNHGSETGQDRGCRQMEVYQCDHIGQDNELAELRSGTAIIHDNIARSGGAGGPPVKSYKLQNHRNQLYKDYGSTRGENPACVRVDGDSIIPVPAVDQNQPLTPNPTGTPSAGNKPENGNVSRDERTGTSAADFNGVSTTFTPTGSPSWGTDNGVDSGGEFKTDFVDDTRNKGFSYQLVNTSNIRLGAGIITGNTANTLTVTVETGGAGNDDWLEFSPTRTDSRGSAIGMNFAIRKVYAPIDSPGMGVSDPVGPTVPLNQIVPNVNTTTGDTPTGNGNVNNAPGTRVIGWPNQKIDPCYNWKNYTGDASPTGSATSGTLLKMYSVQGQIREGTDPATQANTHHFFNVQKPSTGTQWSPGYPVATTQDEKARQIGAEIPAPPGSSTPVCTPYPHLVAAGSVTGLAYPHPLVSAPVVPPPTNAPPIVDITSPPAGAQGPGPRTVSIVACAADTDGTVYKVDFYVSGTTLLGTDSDGSDGFRYDWTSVAPGSYSLTAKATDNGGAATTSAAVAITISTP